MDPDAVDGADRVPHGGECDRDLLEFSANTNPATPEGTGEVYRRALEDARRYPDDGYPEFRRAAARALARDRSGTNDADGVVEDAPDGDGSVDPDRVIPTPGGLAAIRLAVATTVGPGDSVLVPGPSFGEYAREVRLQGATPAFVDHDRVLETDPTDHEMAIVCTPNNPTGEAADPGALRAFADRCAAAGTTLLVDEAFLGFTSTPSVAGTGGTVVARSLTKLYGLPGIRAGYAVATGRHRERLATARRAWNLSTPAAAVGTHCLRDRAFVDRTRRRVRRERARLREALEDLGASVAPSDAPFLLVDLGDRDVDRVLAGFREQGVAVRDARTFRGLDRHVRVAVRDAGDDDRLLEAAAVVLDG